MIFAVFLALSVQTDTAPTAPQPVDAPKIGGTAWQAYVTVRMEADGAGTVDKCEIIETNAPKELADKMCPMLMSKGKFKPKTDEKGAPQRQSATQTIRFEVKD